MSQTTTHAPSAGITATAAGTTATADPAPATTPPQGQRSQLVPAIALGVATVAAVLSLVAITTNNTSTVTPPQPAVQQQNVPAGGELSRGPVVVNVDACGRPIVPGRMACR